MMLLLLLLLLLMLYGRCFQSHVHQRIRISRVLTERRGEERRGGRGSKREEKKKEKNAKTCRREGARPPTSIAKLSKA